VIQEEKREGSLVEEVKLFLKGLFKPRPFVRKDLEELCDWRGGNFRRPGRRVSVQAISAVCEAYIHQIFQIRIIKMIIKRHSHIRRRKLQAFINTYTDDDFKSLSYNKQK
jgi:hypothetical protein